MSGLLFLFSLLVATLPTSPNISEGTIPGGVRYYVARNTINKGYADIAIIQRDCEGGIEESRALLGPLDNSCPTDFFCPKGVSYSDFGFIAYPEKDVRKIEFHNVPFGSKTQRDSTLLVVRDILSRHKNGQAVIICGDVSASEIISTLSTLCLTIPELEPEGPTFIVPEYLPPAADSSQIVIPIENKQPSPEKMNTILPYVGRFLVSQVKFIIGERIFQTFSKEGIPYAIEEDANSIRLSVEENKRDTAKVLVDRILCQLVTHGALFDEMIFAREACIPVVSGSGIASVTSNADLVSRCESAYLYNTALTPEKNLREFLSRKTSYTDDDLAMLNRFLNLSLPAQENEDVPKYDGAYVSRNILLDLPENKHEVKMLSSATEAVTGGKIFTFSNGVKVVYKHSDDPKTNVSLILRGGGGLIPGLTRYEYPYIGSVLETSRIALVPGHDFLTVLRSEGIHISVESGWTDFVLRGQSVPGKLEQTLNAIFKMSYFSEVDTTAFKYAIECVSIGKEAPAIRENFPEIVGAYFKDRFQNWKDGVLMITGPVEETEMITVLETYLSRIKVSGKYSKKVRFDYSIDSGRTISVGENPEKGVVITDRAALRLSSTNYIALRIAISALKARLASDFIPFGMYVETSFDLTVSPKETVILNISCRNCPEAGVPLSVKAPDVVEISKIVRDEVCALRDGEFSEEDLSRYKEIVLRELNAEFQDPETLLKFARYRYSDNRDLCSNYTSVIAKVDAGTVTDVFDKLLLGSITQEISR